MTTSTDVNENEVEETPTQIKPYPEKELTPSIRLKDIPQGSGSKLDSDTIDGLNASTFQNPSPNTLVPLGPNGQLPASVVPTQQTDFTSLETQSPVTSSSVTFTTVLQPDTRYKLIFNLLQNTATGDLHVNFNGDTGVNYQFAAIGLVSTGATATDNSGGSGFIRLVDNLPSGDYAFGDFNFSTVPADNTFVEGTYSLNYKSGGNIVSFHGGAQYNGGAVLSSVTLSTNAGTFTGTLKLYEIS